MSARVPKEIIAHSYNLSNVIWWSGRKFPARGYKISKNHVGRSGSEWRHSTAMPSCQYFLVVSMIWFSYTDKLYINMLGITFSPQNYHHHQQFLSKLREINENVMTSAVWAVIVFGPRVWQLSARRWSSLFNILEINDQLWEYFILYIDLFFWTFSQTFGH